MNKNIFIVGLLILVLTFVGCTAVLDAASGTKKDGEIDNTDTKYIEGIVKSIELGKDGISATIVTEDNKTYSATISLVTTEFTVGKLEDIKEGTKLIVSGEVIELEDKLLIACKTVLINSDQINSQYKTVGEIIGFEKDGVHILTGDIVEVFNVDKEKIKDFYLGEIVGVIENDDEFELVSYKGTDFTIRHTNMGNIITTVSGKIKEVNGNKFVIGTEDGDIEFEAYEELLLEEGTEVSVDYFEHVPGEGDKIFIDIYDETSKIDLTVKNIRRAENGLMVLDAEDEDGLKYEVNVSGVLNFNYSDLKADDEITVYPKVIREIYPTQIDTKMIIKQ